MGSLSAVLICAVLAFGISVFFRVSNFEVSGASYYTESQIIEASGIDEGSNLVFLNRTEAESRISGSLVYVGRVRVSRKLPNTVVIEVAESGTVACVMTETGFWTIDNYCRLLEPASLSETESNIVVSGFTITDPKAGSRITVSEEDKAKVDYLEVLLTDLEAAGMLGDVGGIDMSTSGNAQFTYLERFRVKLGGAVNVESKLGLLKSAVEKLEPGDTGDIDLSVEGRAHFSPGALQ